MIKTIFAFGALTLVAAVPAVAQEAAGALPMCSATLHDSCNQGANNPRAMTAEQAIKSGGVGDRKTDKSDYMAPAMPGKSMTTHRHTTTRHTTMHRKMTNKTPAMMTPDATTEPTPK